MLTPCAGPAPPQSRRKRHNWLELGAFSQCVRRRFTHYGSCRRSSGSTEGEALLKTDWGVLAIERG